MRTAARTSARREARCAPAARGARDDEHGREEADGEHGELDARRSPPCSGQEELEAHARPGERERPGGDRAERERQAKGSATTQPA